MRSGEVSIIAPFRYTAIVFAMAVDFLVWGELVDPFMVAGAAVIIASGLFLSWQGRGAASAPVPERRLSR
jgi:drug/metabolite transporter (DMT)-like permease